MLTTLTTVFKWHPVRRDGLYDHVPPFAKWTKWCGNLICSVTKRLVNYGKCNVKEYFPTILRGMWTPRKKTSQKSKFVWSEICREWIKYQLIHVSISMLWFNWDNWDKKKDLLRLDVYRQHEAVPFWIQNGSLVVIPSSSPTLAAVELRHCNTAGSMGQLHPFIPTKSAEEDVLRW